MREENWYKMFIVALLLHVVLLAGFSIPLRKTTRKVDLSSYSVNLVGDMGPAPTSGSAGAAPPVPPAAKKAKPVLREPAKKAEQKEPTKAKPVAKPVLQAKEKERSITPSKAKPVEEEKPAPPKKENRSLETASRDEVTSLDERIRQMRSRTQYMDVGGGSRAGTVTKSSGGDSGLTGSGSGGARPLDPALYAYYLEVQERIERAWRSPGLAKKALETVIAIRIRKDGRIMDWQIEERSGDRVFDETVARTLRSIDVLPPIPASLNLPDVEVGFRFHP